MIALSAICCSILQADPSRIWRTREVTGEVRKRPDGATVPNSRISETLNAMARMAYWSNPRPTAGPVKVSHGHWQWQWLGADLDWL